ncbi:pantetheine-phosphate adenylyltransferase [Limobrevibacterium gyesilva]|uniref:Phosphopantetheine adenylyltransferase n=1 Tax=Limobrevibacterium gyesilva TaxID=2991712 RepID=A0AA42CIA1_9PROT|nr:pantetheine-phosphate adenylyltransferase [Limobrevibacterium gyesilva]MCW3475727.1 pantetheine-phosphate adenylyltransferase [Limobrevibacterium gyesilva]
MSDTARPATVGPRQAKPPRTGLYPGTFDPIHNGHIDIISRAARIVDRLVIGVATNIGKGPLFPLEERLELVREECDIIARRTGTPIEVHAFDTLLVTLAQQVGAGLIVRGLRAVSDFDYEFQMAGMNARLDRNVETVFLPASEGQHFISSRFVKEIAILGGDISSFVSPLTLERTMARVGRPAAAPARARPA